MQDHTHVQSHEVDMKCEPLGTTAMADMESSWSRYEASTVVGTAASADDGAGTDASIDADCEEAAGAGAVASRPTSSSIGGSSASEMRDK